MTDETTTPDLDDYLTEGEEAGEIQPLDEHTDLDRVNRVLHRYGVLLKRIEANAELAKKQRDKVTEWETKVNTPLQEQATYLAGELAFYARKSREHNEKMATISLPAGKLATRVNIPTVDVTDEKAFVSWAIKHKLSNLYKITTKPVLASIKKDLTAMGQSYAYVNADGEMDNVPGVAVKMPEFEYGVTIQPSS